jgi:hypothetical protein
LIGTLSLQGEVLEGHLPQRFEALVGRNCVPEGSIEGAIVAVQIDQPASAETAPLISPHDALVLYSHGHQ